MKIVFSDLDGTLLLKNETKINRKIKNSIYSLLESGINFVVSSGRTYVELKYFFKEFENDIFFSANYGALVVYKEQTLYNLAINTSEFCNAEKFAAHGKYITYVCTKDRLLMRNIIKQHNGHTIQIDSAKEICEPIYKLTDYDMSLNYNLLQVYSDATMKEYANPNVNKGESASKILAHLNLKAADAIAFGDNVNDISLFEACGKSYAVANALPKVKKAADAITRDIAEDMKKLSQRRN